MIIWLPKFLIYYQLWINCPIVLVLIVMKHADRKKYTISRQLKEVRHLRKTFKGQFNLSLITNRNTGFLWEKFNVWTFLSNCIKLYLWVQPSRVHLTIHRLQSWSFDCSPGCLTNMGPSWIRITALDLSPRTPAAWGQNVWESKIDRKLSCKGRGVFVCVCFSCVRMRLCVFDQRAEHRARTGN